jgi:hypothetical protein
MELLTLGTRDPACVVVHSPMEILVSLYQGRGRLQTQGCPLQSHFGNAPAREEYWVSAEAEEPGRIVMGAQGLFFVKERWRDPEGEFYPKHL